MKPGAGLAWTGPWDFRAAIGLTGPNTPGAAAPFCVDWRLWSEKCRWKATRCWCSEIRAHVFNQGLHCITLYPNRAHSGKIQRPASTTRTSRTNRLFVVGPTRPCMSMMITKVGSFHFWMCTRSMDLAKARSGAGFDCHRQLITRFNYGPRPPKHTRRYKNIPVPGTSYMGPLRLRICWRYDPRRRAPSGHDCTWPTTICAGQKKPHPQWNMGQTAGLSGAGAWDAAHRRRWNHISSDVRRLHR